MSRNAARAAIEDGVEQRVGQRLLECREARSREVLPVQKDLLASLGRR